ncbi:unnamed protein product [Laminaria digitata]
MEEEDEKRAAKALESLMNDFSDPEIADSLEKAFRQLGGHVEGEEALKEGFQAAKAAEKEEAERIAQGGDGTENERRDSQGRPSTRPAAPGPSAAAAATAATAGGEAAGAGTGVGVGAGAGAAGGGGEYGFGGGGTEMDRTIFRTLEMLSKSGAGMEGQDAAAMEGGGEDIMQQMMGEFGKMGEKEARGSTNQRRMSLPQKDYNGMMDNIMEQLLSRELMYDPIKQICDKYPEWLATHRDKLAAADYQRYGQQYQSFQRVLAVYETEPDNFPRLMELMQDMQEHGQVPAEIIKELAPGLEFNAEGAPIMPNVGEGMMPNIPGFPAGDGQNCVIS